MERKRRKGLRDFTCISEEIWGERIGVLIDSVTKVPFKTKVLIWGRSLQRTSRRLGVQWKAHCPQKSEDWSSLLTGPVGAFTLRCGIGSSGFWGPFLWESLTHPA